MVVVVSILRWYKVGTTMIGCFQIHIVVVVTCWDSTRYSIDKRFH